MSTKGDLPALFGSPKTLTVSSLHAQSRKPTRIDVCERKAAPLPTGTTAALAEGTASIELASEAETATATEPEAFGAQGAW